MIGPSKPSHEDLTKLRGIGNYQFGDRIGDELFRSDIEVCYSRRTGRIRLVFWDKQLLCTLKPTSGFIALAPAAARIILMKCKPPSHRVIVEDAYSPFIRKGRNVFAKHVIAADRRIKPDEEVAVANENDELLAVGRAVLSYSEMRSFGRGVAVKVRTGVEA